MKISASICFAAVILGAGVCQAQQQPSNYVGVRLGNSDNHQSGLQAINPRVTGVTDTSIKDTGVWSLAFGHRYASNWRAEIEYADRGSAGMIVNTVGAGFSGRNELKAKSWSLMANAYYDVPMSSNFLFFGQAGLGYARVNLSGTQFFQAPANTGAFNFGTSFPGATKGNMAWSLGLGGQYKFSPQYSLDFGARYVNLGKMETNIDTVNRDEQFRAKLNTTEVYGGLRYTF